MPKVRILIILSTTMFLAIFGTLLILVARGYRFQLEDKSISVGPTGLLVANSDPKAAEVYVNGKLETATDNTISLPPGTHQVMIKKEGYQTWEKTLEIEKEAVTQIDAFLLPAAPTLTPMTFSGAANPMVSEDNTKIAYIVPESVDNIEKAGLWIIESVNLPLGFNREPRQLTDGDLTEAEYQFSPNAREILLTTENGTYLIDTSTFTPRTQLINIELQKESILEEWKEEHDKRLAAKIAPLPDPIEEIFADKAKRILFSPDENRILYTASQSAELPSDLVRKLPGSSTQPETRQLTPEESYVYDIREDKNFRVAEADQVLYWLPNSLNLVHPTESSINVLDYDGTNEKIIFSAGYEYPHAYATSSENRILMLTNLGAVDQVQNLYWLSLK